MIRSAAFFGKSGKRVSESITLSLKVSSAKLHFHLLLITRFRQFSTVKRKRAVQKIQLLRWDVDDEDITLFDQLPLQFLIHDVSVASVAYTRVAD